VTASSSSVSPHHHPDHSAANPELAKRWDVPVFGHVSDARRLPGFTDGLEEGDGVAVGRETARVLFIPAHTRGHIAYVFDAAAAVFCGDTLFAAGCGRLFEGTPEMMFAALHTKLAALPDATRVYCGHEYTLSNIRFAKAADPGNAALADLEERAKQLRDRGLPTLPSTIGQEKATNPFVRVREPSVIDSANRYAGKTLNDPVSVLAAIRQWKNSF
jgi:hydroxyacylglutathione hydrolase